MVILLMCALAWGAPEIKANVRPSLREMLGRLQKGPEITELFKKTLKSETLTEKDLRPLEKPNLVLLREFQNLALESANLQRGEIEDEKVLSDTLTLLQLSVLRMRAWSEERPVEKKFAAMKDESRAWFQFAADLPYNEASLVGLRVAGVVRSFLIDELERLERDQGEAMARDEMWLNWLLQLRTPWPVDRILLTESKRILHPESMALAEKVAAKIQKNPYLSVEKALKQIPGGKPTEVQVLKTLWREQDMDAMKAEVNRLQTLRLRLAARLYAHRKGKAPARAEDLVEARLLASVPIDYVTGRPMPLPSPAALPQTDKSPSPANSP